MDVFPISAAGQLCPYRKLLTFAGLERRKKIICLCASIPYCTTCEHIVLGTRFHEGVQHISSVWYHGERTLTPFNIMYGVHFVSPVVKHHSSFFPLFLGGLLLPLLVIAFPPIDCLVCVLFFSIHVCWVAIKWILDWVWSLENASSRFLCICLHTPRWMPHTVIDSTVSTNWELCSIHTERKKTKHVGLCLLETFVCSSILLVFFWMDILDRVRIREKCCRIVIIGEDMWQRRFNFRHCETLV